MFTLLHTIRWCNYIEPGTVAITVILGLYSLFFSAIKINTTSTATPFCKGPGGISLIFLILTWFFSMNIALGAPGTIMYD
jgi:hypothetical protein